MKANINKFKEIEKENRHRERKNYHKEKNE